MPYTLLLRITLFSIFLGCIALTDSLFHLGIKDMLPESAQNLIWYPFIFGTPHIVASFFSYAHSGYYTHYKKLILQSLGVSLLLVFVSFIFLPHYAMYLFIAYTMYHVASQQIGLSRPYSTNKTSYDMWKYFSLVGIIAITLFVGGENMMVPLTIMLPFLLYTGSISLGLATFFGYETFKTWNYGMATVALFTLALLVILLGYPFVGILMARLSHDISAYSIYITHAWKGDTLFTRESLRYYTPVFYTVFFSLLSLGISYLLVSHVNSVFVLIIVMVLSLMHYMLEGKVWKKGGMHRGMLGN
jgi:small-conductance mechanosensitive channel